LKNSTNVRAALYVTVAALAYAALQSTPPTVRSGASILAAAGRGPTPAASAPTSVADASYRRVDSLGRGESLNALLGRQGLRGATAAGALAALRDIGHLSDRRIPAGLEVVASGSVDSVPTDLVFHLAADRLLHLTRTADGWSGVEEKLAWAVDTVAVEGSVNSTLYEALDSSATALPRALRLDLAWKLADIFEHRVDMSRDLQPGDNFRALVERATAPNGAERIAGVLAASFTLSGSEVDAVRFRSAGASGEYFDQNGKALKSGFLRAPLEFRRISGVFGLRHHPILGVWRMHKGTDYAAAQGTPVRAIGDGVVVFAGVKHGYGNVIDVRHRNGYVSRYGHLRRFATGVRVGSHVPMGQTIAYVGMTGLATAPHLHFEMLVGGAQRDSRSVLAKLKGGDPIAGGERDAFERTRERLMAALDHGTPAARTGM
jgi:murein DD-endopeptidase MepM/ murein hydrolase activator NlpD